MASATCTVEELYLFQKLLRGIGCHNIDHRLMQADFTDQAQLPDFPWLGQRIADLQELDSALIIGSNVRQELPLINYRLHKAADHGAEIFVVNPADFEFNWEAVGRLIQSPSATESVLAGIVKALAEDGCSSEVAALVADTEWTRELKIEAEGLRGC